MNYLAHAYLSFNEPAILVGNMISDFVKGKKQYDYPLSIQKGIQLHRAIDTFTDTHEATKQLKEFFKKEYRLYAGAFADVVYDYFLANDTLYFHNEEARLKFTEHTYGLLEEQHQLLPPTFAKMLPYMKAQNWLYNYAFDWGIQKSFIGLSKRALYIKETNTAFELFLNNKVQMQQCYNDFFPSLLIFTHQKLKDF